VANIAPPFLLKILLCMNIYEYVADANPNETRSLIQEYGYRTFGGLPLEQVTDSADLAEGLKQLVNSKGENALMDIADIHPDKDLLYSKFEQDNSSKTATTSSSQPLVKSGCGCGCGGNHGSNSQANGLMPSFNKSEGFYINQTQAIMLMGAALVVIALVAKN
jgi:hypothetical protein